MCLILFLWFLYHTHTHTHTRKKKNKSGIYLLDTTSVFKKYLSIYLSIYPNLFLLVSIYLSIYLSISVCFHRSHFSHLSIYLSIYLSKRLQIWRSEMTNVYFYGLPNCLQFCIRSASWGILKHFRTNEDAEREFQNNFVCVNAMKHVANKFIDQVLRKEKERKSCRD